MIGELLGYLAVGAFSGIFLSALLLVIVKSRSQGTFVFKKLKSPLPLTGGAAVQVWAQVFFGLAWAAIACLHWEAIAILAGLHLSVAFGSWFAATRVFQIDDATFGYRLRDQWPLARVRSAAWDGEAEVLRFRSDSISDIGERDIVLPLTPAAWGMLREKMAEQKVVTA